MALKRDFDSLQEHLKQQSELLDRFTKLPERKALICCKGFDQATI